MGELDDDNGLSLDEMLHASDRERKSLHGDAEGKTGNPRDDGDGAVGYGNQSGRTPYSGGGAPVHGNGGIPPVDNRLGHGDGGVRDGSHDDGGDGSHAMPPQRPLPIGRQQQYGRQTPVTPRRPPRPVMTPPHPPVNGNGTGNVNGNGNVGAPVRNDGRHDDMSARHPLPNQPMPIEHARSMAEHDGNGTGTHAPGRDGHDPVRRMQRPPVSGPVSGDGNGRPSPHHPYGENDEHDFDYRSIARHEPRPHVGGGVASPPEGNAANGARHADNAIGGDTADLFNRGVAAATHRPYHGTPPTRAIGERGRDRRRRSTRTHYGRVRLSNPQLEIVNNANRRHPHRGRNSFVMTEADRRVFNFLARWRFATRADIARIAGWDGQYGSKGIRALDYQKFGFARLQRIPLELLMYVQLTKEGTDLSDYGYLNADPALAISASSRSHSLGLSSLASQLLAVDDRYDDYEHYDLLGLGRGWTALRHDIRDGRVKVIAEREYRSSFSRMRKQLDPPSRSTPKDIRDAMTRVYYACRQGNALDATPDFTCCDPANAQEDWQKLWVVYGGYIERDEDVQTMPDRYGYGRPLLIDDADSVRPLDGKMHPICTAGDRLITRDHLPDMVLARRRNPNPHSSSEISGSIAIELELTSKKERYYDQTMAGFISPRGKMIYSSVIWLVTNAGTASLIRRGAGDAGAREGVDYTIVPVASADAKSTFYEGADMCPGVLETTQAGVEHGYSILRDISRSVLTDDDDGDGDDAV